MSSGLLAIAPRHTVHRRSQSASTMTVRPLPPIPVPAHRGHTRATSLDYRRIDVQQRPSGPRGPPRRTASEGHGGNAGPTPEQATRPENGDKGSGHSSAIADASSSYLSLDEYAPVFLFPIVPELRKLAVTRTQIHCRTSSKMTSTRPSSTSTTRTARCCYRSLCCPIHHTKDLGCSRPHGVHRHWDPSCPSRRQHLQLTAPSLRCHLSISSDRSTTRSLPQRAHPAISTAWSISLRGNLRLSKRDRIRRMIGERLWTVSSGKATVSRKLDFSSCFTKIWTCTLCNYTVRSCTDAAV